MTNPYVEINLDPSTFNYANVNADGSDLRFIDADNATELQYRLKSWVPNGVSTVGIIVPQISADNFDHVFLYKNSPLKSASTKTITAPVYALYHLEENPPTLGTSCVDSSGNSLNGTYEDVVGSTDPVSVPGIVNRAVHFIAPSTLSGDAVALPTTMDLSLPLYIEFYLNATYIPSRSDGYEIFYNSPTTASSDANLIVGASLYPTGYRMDCDYKGTSGNVKTSGLGPLIIHTYGAWHKVNIQITTSGLILLVDDVVIRNATWSGTPSNINPTRLYSYIGNARSTGLSGDVRSFCLDGILDEFSISHTILPTLTPMPYVIGPEEKGWPTRV